MQIDFFNKFYYDIIVKKKGYGFITQKLNSNRN